MRESFIELKDTIAGYVKRGYIVFFIGILVYLRFIIFNIFNPDSLIERDDLYYRVGYGWTISLGRYGQAILGKILSDEISHYVFQILAILLLSFTIYLIIRILKIKETKFNLLSIGLIIICSNNFSQVLTYNQTSLFYTFSYLLIILSIYILSINRKLFIISLVLITISLCIYQSFIISAIAICLFIIIADLLENKFELKKYLSFAFVGVGGGSFICSFFSSYKIC